jgi:dolichol-phosphate mannosyltransferase
MSECIHQRICLIVPCYNEEDVLPEFFRRIQALARALPDKRIETLYVDDGSDDRTPDILRDRAATDPRMRVLVLSRNFGHQAAITAGLDHCDADVAVILDADLQDPPELVRDIALAIAQGADVVHMVRSRRPGDSISKRWSAKAFYAFMSRWGIQNLPEDSGDFKGLSRRAVSALRRYPERVRFMRGMIAELGFVSVRLPYVRDLRHAGQSKYPWSRILRLATDAAVSHSHMPMRMLLWAGAGSVAISAFSPLALGWNVSALLAFLIVFYAGLILMGLGLAGEVMTRILAEVKQRPLYLVKQRFNCGPLLQLPEPVREGAEAGTE